MVKLYIVGTPIGNLEDISMRALRILGEVDFILCEDTRVTKKLLKHFEIQTPTISYHQHSSDNKHDYILKLLRSGQNLALVTDAGTPGISDPCGKLVQQVIEELGDEVGVESVPGPSAVTAALSISGVFTDKFTFFGFLPHKKGRQAMIDRISEIEEPVVVYESKHRILKLLKELIDLNIHIEQYNLKIEKQDPYTRKKKGLTKKRQVESLVVCRELSKMHETVYRGTIESIIDRIKNNKDDQKGEFVVIIA